MPQQVYVNASTSVVQIDSSQIITGEPAIVYLSSIYAPGTLITIRDIAGYASATKSIVVSTTQGLHFLDGTQVSSYSITQPFGFITVNPKTSTIWALMNTFAFPDQSAAALVNSITAVTGTTSTLYSYQALISTAAISSISTDTVFVRTNLSVGQSTIANDIYLRSTLTAIGGISTAATLFASTAVVTRSLVASSTLQTPFAQLNFSTGLALDVAGSIRTASTISTLGPLFVGGLISTASDLAVGGSTLIAGQLRVGAHTLLQSTLSTVGSFSLGGTANLASTLTTKDNAMFQAHVSVASNVTVGGYLSVMSSMYLHGLLTVSSGFVLYGLFSTASSINVGQNMSIAGDLAVGGDVFFNDRLLDLDNLSIIQCLNVGNTISTLSSIAAGGSLQIAGSTLLIGPVSTGSTLTVASHLSTVGNLAIGGSAYFASTLTVGGALCTLSNLAVGGTLRVSSTTVLAQGLSTVGQGAFFSSVQIQGGLSVFSSLAVSCNVDIQGILSAKGFNLGGAAVVSSLGITQATGWGLNVSSSTLHYGHISTMGGIDMVGRFSTPNVIATGSTLFTSFATVSNNLSTLANTNVGGALNVLGVTTLGGTTNAVGYANFTNGLSTITNTNVGGQLNVLGAATVGGTFTAVGTANFNTNTTTTGVATFNGAGGGGVGVIVTNNLTVNGGTINANSATANVGTIVVGSGIAAFNEQQLGDLRAPGPVILGATTSGRVLITSTLSTVWNAAFYSSVQIQGSLSVFSSVAIAGFLTAARLSLSGAITVSTFTTGLGASPGFTAILSTSTLSYGLFSTLGSMNVGDALTVGSNINVLGTSAVTAASVTGSNSLLTNALTASNTVTSPSVTGSNNVFSLSVTGSNSVLTNAINSSNSITVATGSLTPTAGYRVDVAGAVRTTGNHLIVNAAPTLTLSNTNVNAYSIYTNPGANAGSFVITKNDNSATAILIAPSGNVGINTNSASYQLDVNGTARFAGLITASGGISGNIETATRATQAYQLIAGTATAPSFQVNVWYPSADSINRLYFGNNATTYFGTASTYEFKASDSSAILMGLASNSGQGNGILTTGLLRIANGSAATPSYSFSNLTNAGLYMQDGGIGLATGGTRAIYVNSSQRVGIATDSPAYTLDVNGTFNTTTLYVNGQQFVPGALGTTVTTSNILTSTLTTSTLTTTTTAYLTNTATQQRWVITGSINSVLNFFSSTDGRTWSSTHTGLAFKNNGSVGNAVAYNGSIWVIGGSTGSSSVLYTSPNGTAWVTNPTTLNQTNCYGLAWNGSYWLILGAATTAINTIIKANATLTSFTSSASGGAAGFATQANAAAWNGSMWVAVGFDGANPNMKYSYDGTNWTNAASGRIAGGGNAVIWNGYMWVAGGVAGGSFLLWYSYNGINWTASPNATTLMTSSCQSIAWNGTVFVAGGYSPGVGRLIYSYDGITWTAVSGFVLNFNVFSVVWNGTLFVAAGNGSAAGTTSSPDGITWTTQVSGPGSSDNMSAVGFSSNVNPDAVIGTVAFQSKQPQYLFSTPTINAGSNWLSLANTLKVTSPGATLGSGTVDVHGITTFDATILLNDFAYMRGVPSGQGTISNAWYMQNYKSTLQIGWSNFGATLHLLSGRVGVNTDNPLFNLDVAGSIRSYGSEIICSNDAGPFGQIRMISGNYGAFWRNDGNNLFLLLTNSGNQYGVWNGLRPFQVNLASGNVVIVQALSVEGGVTSGTFNVGSRINFPNKGVLYGSNTAGTEETCLIPRWEDNCTYLDYGSGGFYIRRQGGPVAMFMANNRNIGIKTDNPQYALDINGGNFRMTSSGGQALTNSIIQSAFNTPTNPPSARTMVGSIQFGSGFGPWLNAYQANNAYGDWVDFSICTNEANNNTTIVERLTVSGGAPNGGATRVGIDTTLPAYCLDVGGSAPASNLAIPGYTNSGPYNANTQSSASLHVTRSVGGFISYTVSFYYNNPGGTNQYQVNNIHTYIPRATYAIMHGANVQNAAGNTTINWGNYQIQIYGGRNVDGTGGSDLGFNSGLGVPGFQSGTYAYYNNQSQGAAGFVRIGITILNFFLPNTTINNGNGVQTVI